VSPSNLAWVEDNKACKTHEIRNIQGKDVADSVHIHCCGQSRIMHLDTYDAVLRHDASPLSVDGLTVSQEGHAVLDCSHVTFNLTNSQSQPVSVQRTSHDVPKLSDVLVRIAKGGSLRSEVSQRRMDQVMLWIGTPGNA